MPSERENPPGATRPAEEQRAGSTSARPRVLVIDDEFGPRESLRILLKPECDVICAASVDEGLGLFRESSPDLVIMDIRMPGRTGIDGLGAIRRLDPVVSVIMLTGYGTLETAQLALRLGANDYLKKPFDTHEMFGIVRANINRTRFERRRVRAKHELQDLNRRLLEQLVRRDQLADLGQKSMELAHDISSPLAAIMGYAKVLAEQLGEVKCKLGEQYGDCLESLNIIDTSVGRCNDLLNFWRSEKLGQARTRAPVAMRAIVNDLAKAMKLMAANAGARLDVRAAPEACLVLADSIQVYRAIQNLVANAIQALRGPGGWIKLTCRADGDQAEVCVEDNGCGIAAEDREKIFDMYYTTKVGRKGLGLGMFITRSVINAHGGTIKVESQPRQGTRMVVRLPLCAETA